MSRFGGADCCTSAVLDLGEAIASPHHRQRGLVRASPDGALQALFPAHIDGLPPASRAAPRHMEDIPQHEEAGLT